MGPIERELRACPPTWAAANLSPDAAFFLRGARVPGENAWFCRCIQCRGNRGTLPDALSEAIEAAEALGL